MRIFASKIRRNAREGGMLLRVYKPHLIVVCIGVHTTNEDNIFCGRVYTLHHDFPTSN